MIKVYNLTKQTESTCDAIETINNEYRPVELEFADGFKALTIVHVSPSEEYYTEEIFAFEDHTLPNNEDTGRYEEEEDPEEEEEPTNE